MAVHRCNIMTGAQMQWYDRCSGAAGWQCTGAAVQQEGRCSSVADVRA